MTRYFKYPVVVLLACLSGITAATSQEDSATADDLKILSLQDLLKVKIVSASKKSEFLFDAPLSASVVTRDEFRKAGCTSIMEALRLVPGMMVREQTNGNYDIYLRGMDNVPTNSTLDGNSTTTLVMIDNRPIYNYLKGGTFWETLPIDLNDVEKIEVIRGPAAALYGPNAVNGVINIITRSAKKDGLYLLVDAQQGNLNTIINNAAVGFRSKKWNVIASGNYQHRDRSQNSYYEIARNTWLDDPAYYITFLGDTVQGPLAPEKHHALKKYAGNLFVGFEPSEDVKLTFASGLQYSLSQRVSTENGITALATAITDSRYADLRAYVKGFTAQLSGIMGTQTPSYPDNKYDFSTIDAVFEYNYNRNNLTIKPGVSYRKAIYDDVKYSDRDLHNGIFNARGVITTKTASLRGEYRLFNEKLRLVAGAAINKFNHPDTTYLSYQFAVTYKRNAQHLFRAVFSRAPRSATIYDAYINQRAPLIPIGYQKFLGLNLEGNKDIKLLISDMIELGYRCNLTDRLSIDAELFHIHSKNFSSIVIHARQIKLQGSDTLLITPLIPTNLPVTLRQLGLTFSVLYQHEKVQVKSFVTIQRSRVRNYAPYLNTPDATWPVFNNPLLYNIYSGMGTERTSTGTPTVFGGAMVNWKPAKKFNVNLNTYYFDNHTYHHASNIVFNDGERGVDHISSKLIINSTVSFEPSKGLTIYCSGKNILNQHKREYFRTDMVPGAFLVGLNYEF